MFKRGSNFSKSRREMNVNLQEACQKRSRRTVENENNHENDYRERCRRPQSYSHQGWRSRRAKKNNTEYSRSVESKKRENDEPSTLYNEVTPPSGNDRAQAKGEKQK